MAANYFPRNKPDLQAAQREGMWALKQAGYTGEQIAEQYECSYNNVKQILSRYRKRLEKELKARQERQRIKAMEEELLTLRIENAKLKETLRL